MPRRNKTPRSSEYRATAEEECRRRWGRYPLQDTTVAVSTGTYTFEAVTSDESIGGLGLITTHTSPLVPDQPLRISFRNEEMEGVVTAVFDQNDGSRRFSVRWANKDGKIEKSREHPFVAVNGVVVACQVVSGEGTTPAKIRLWNGNEFNVEPEKLMFRTKEARRSELHALEDEVELLAKIYEMKLRIGTEVLVDRILDFEFVGSVV